MRCHLCNRSLDKNHYGGIDFPMERVVIHEGKQHCLECYIQEMNGNRYYGV